MIQSMTGFAASQTHCEDTHIAWEIKTVNHRYLDISFRLPEQYRQLESQLRKQVKLMISRGKVDIQLKLKKKGCHTKKLTIDLDRIESIIAGIEKADGRLAKINPVSWDSLISLPDVVLEQEDDGLKDDVILNSFDDLLVKINKNRQTEGQYLQQLIEERLTQLKKYHHDIFEKVDELSLNIKRKLQKRCAELADMVTEDRLMQEVAIILTKMDVSEELDRLDSHCQQVLSALAMTEPVGRRLDFLMQELSREINTLGVKIEDADVRRMTVDMKVLVEQMREQIQNVE